MMRTLRALISCMLRSIVALLKAPATRGSALLASQQRASRPRSTASTKPVDTSPSPSSAVQRVAAPCRRSGPSSRARCRPPAARSVRAVPSSTSTRTRSPTRTPSLSASRSVSTRPRPLEQRLAAVDVDHAVQLRRGRRSRGSGCARAGGHGSKRDRRRSGRFDRGHAGQPRQLAARARRRPASAVHTVTSPRIAERELRVDDDVDRVAQEVAHHDDRHRRRDAADRERRCAAAGAPCCARSCAAPGRMPLDAEALEQRAPVAAGRRRAHRLGRRQPHGGGDRVQRAEHRGGHARRQRWSTSSHGAMRCSKRGKWKNSAYRPVSIVPSQSPSSTPSTSPTATISQHQLQVVQRDRAVGVAERLQRGDLLALRRHQARHHHVEQEGRDAEEDRRQHGAQHALLLDLVVEHRVRGLLVAAVRVAPAVGRRAVRVRRVDHRALATRPAPAGPPRG